MFVAAYDHPAPACKGTSDEFIVLRVFSGGFRQGLIRKNLRICCNEIENRLNIDTGNARPMFLLPADIPQGFPGKNQLQLPIPPSFKNPV
jgi:hypothetical protein